MQENYTAEVGQKFHADGSVRTYPGNTVICFVDSVDHASIFKRLVWLQDQLRSRPWHSKFALLPPSSFHMTVMDLLCDHQRHPAYWSNRLPLTMDISETDSFFKAQVSAIPAPSTLRMKCNRLPEFNMYVELESADDETEQALRRYRNAIADVTGVRFPEHDQYKFHISLAYQLIHLTPEEKVERQALYTRLTDIVQQSNKPFVLNAPQLVFFDNMFQFVTYQERHTLTTR